MQCDNCLTDISIVVSPMPDHFLHECTECGWCHRVHRQSVGNDPTSADWLVKATELYRNKH